MNTRRRRGAQAVEFALVLPVLMALGSGVLDFGWFFVQKNIALSVVRSAARDAAAVPLDKDPVARARAEAKAGLAAQGMAKNAKVDAALVGDRGFVHISVTVALPFQPLVGLVPAPETVDAHLEMRVEQQPLL